jgi:rhodanese-related sulfurtransferase
MDTTPKRFHLLLAILLTALPLAACQTRVNDAKVPRISVQEVARRLEKNPAKTLVLDVRDPERFAEGRIPNAQLVSLPEIDAVDPTPEFEGYGIIVVYGQNPGAGPPMALAKRLIHVKHDDVNLMEGGFDAWRASGFPVESD